ncbi:uroporphyrinogen-III C-methyltransferase [Staphylococcus massiliensis]|uniref:uroporphyrinogen-III C-methyltransferase n=1 Tax=Staphylococcus massiliensis TaxID=555791 RepID=UPI001EE00485|nr:uroporphyrinogen-III C-methyltransferase [Staphylococcus massiliensis]MCG3399292.1 uroporphyrinogen-III C-methyltransferase [Staphylococcus massiliensis]
MCITKGFVSLVGAGPGHPDLLSRKAERVIKRADIILYDRLVNPFIIQFAKPEAELINVGKIPYGKQVKQEKINALLVEAAFNHKHVVRLKGGDPAIFGRVKDEVEALEAEGIAYEIVPGITSASAAVASYGVGLTERNVATSITFTTGHFKDSMERDIDITSLLDGGTLAIYMGVKRLPMLMDFIMTQAKVDYNVVVIFNATRFNEFKVEGTVSNIADQVANVDVAGPAVIIVGDVTTSILEKQHIIKKRFLIKGMYDDAMTKALDLYDDGYECFIEVDEAETRHPSQRAFQREIIEETHFDDFIKV